MQAAALGFATHSGWNALVVVAGTPREPEVALRDRILLADETLPGSKQPYHYVEDWSLPEAKRHLDKLSKSAQTMAGAALGLVLKRLDDQGLRPKKAGILESSGRKGVPLERILASHALIHTADGEHFREALELACASCGLTVERVPQKVLLGRASDTLR